MESIVFDIGIHPQHKSDCPMYFLENQEKPDNCILLIRAGTKPWGDEPDPSCPVMRIKDLPYFSRDRYYELVSWIQTTL